MSNEQYEENKELGMQALDEQDLEDVTGGVGRFSGAFNNTRFTFANEFKANGIGAAFKSIGTSAKDGWNVGKAFGQGSKASKENQRFQENLNAGFNK
jgi:hypothetical protein